MRPMKRIILWLMALALASCGGSQTNKNPQLIGRDSSWFPLELGKEAPNLTAFTNALIQEINHLEHSSLQITNVAWAQLFYQLETGDVGAILAALPPNVITENKFSFSDPLLLLGPVLIVPVDSPATGLSDLKGKVVAVYQFDESVLIAQDYPVVIQLYENKPMILEALSQGKVDAVLMPVLDARRLVLSLYPLELKMVTEPLNAKAIRLITLKNQNKRLLRKFNRGLQKAEQTGSYFKLRKEYGLN